MAMVMELLISVGVVAAIAVALAVLMVIADATIGNYGEKKVTVNDDKELTVTGGLTLLTALKEQGLFIPSACGGRGSCGLCKVKVAAGGGEILATELPWLSAGERAAKVRLSCQFKVKNDLKIAVPQELLSVREYTAEVTRIVDLTRDLKEVTFALRGPATIDFKAGQYVQLEVSPYELTDEPLYRAYSVASAPSMKDRLELEIKYVPEGIATTWVHRHLAVGDIVTLNGPYGDFGLHDGDRDIIMMATGSGMAPMRSILLDMAEKGSARKVTYLFGCKERCDLFLLDEMRELEKRLPNFRFVPAISRPNAEDGWDGQTGRLTDILPQYIPNGAAIEAYLCAGSAVIKSYIAALTAIGVARERIYFDDFG